MITECLCQPSAVVVTADTVRDLRLDVEQRTAGEDHLFWSNLALDGATKALSWHCNVDCGRRVDIYFSAFDWNQPETLDRVGHLLLLCEKRAETAPARVLSAATNAASLRRYRRAYGRRLCTNLCSASSD